MEGSAERDQAKIPAYFRLPAIDNRERFIAGEDFIEVTRDVIRTDMPEGVFHPKAPRGFLITRRGSSSWSSRVNRLFTTLC